VLLPCRNQQLVTAAQAAWRWFSVQLDQGTALQQQHPFMLALFVPEPLWTGGSMRMNALEPQLLCFKQHADAFFTPGR